MNLKFIGLKETINLFLQKSNLIIKKHYKTSGAKEIIFKKFLSLSSLAIGPKTLLKYYK